MAVIMVASNRRLLDLATHPLDLTVRLCFSVQLGAWRTLDAVASPGACRQSFDKIELRGSVYLLVPGASTGIGVSSPCRTAEQVITSSA